MSLERLIAGVESKSAMVLLMEMAGTKSEAIADGIIDHLVGGYSLTVSANLNSVDVSNLHRELKRLDAFAVNLWSFIDLSGFSISRVHDKNKKGIA